MQGKKKNPPEFVKKKISRLLTNQNPAFLGLLDALNVYCDKFFDITYRLKIIIYYYYNIN